MKLANDRGEAAYSKTLYQLSSKVLECVEEDSGAKKKPEGKSFLGNLKAKLEKREIKDLLEKLPAALDLYRSEN